MMILKIPPAIVKIAPDGNLTLRQKRRVMIDFIKRRVQPGSGSGIEFLLTRTAFHEWPDLRKVLQGIPWVVVGGVATRAYMPEMETNDFDILIHLRDAPRAGKKLRACGFRKIHDRMTRALRYETDQGKIIHLIPSKKQWLKRALDHPARDAANLPTIPLAYLTLLKLQSHKMQDWADVSRMAGLATEAAQTEVRRVIARHSPDDLEDLESLIWAGKKELEMPPPQKTPPRKRKLVKQGA